MSFSFFQTCMQEDGYHAPSTLGLNADRPAFGIGDVRATLDSTTALPSYLEIEVAFEPVFMSPGAAQAVFCQMMHPGHASWVGASVYRPTPLYPDPPLIEDLKPVKAIGVRVAATQLLALWQTDNGVITHGPDLLAAGWHLKNEDIFYTKTFLHQEGVGTLSARATHDALYSNAFSYAGSYHPHPAKCRQLYGVLSKTYPLATEVIVMADLGEKEGETTYLTQVEAGGVRVACPSSLATHAGSLEDDIQGGKLKLPLYLDDEVSLSFSSLRCRHIAENRYRMTFIHPANKER